jgi:peptide/nickel transport system substrate-binding protein
MSLPRMVACCLVACLVAQAAWAGEKTLVVGVSSDIHTLDPGVSSDNYDWRQIYPCYDRLVRYKVVDGKGSTEVEPSAAESWTVSPDGLVWTFSIRDGISFADGTPLDAEAVRFSLQRILDIGKGPADTIGAIDSMRVTDPRTLEITLKTAYGPFLQTLATNGASIVNPRVMRHARDNDLAQTWLATNMDGSGPFRMAEWQRGQRFVLEANKQYWGEAPTLDWVIIRFMPESAERSRALDRGDIDIAEHVLIEQVPALEKNPDISVQRHPSQLVEYVYINTRKDALRDRRVRQALSYAVDYQGIIDFVLQGNGVQMRGPVPLGMWGHKADVFQYSRNVAKAKTLLQEAGAEGLELTLIYSERRPSWQRIASIMQANFAQIGVQLNLRLLDNPTLRDQVDKGDFELCLGVWSPDFADPFMFMNFWFDSNFWGLPGNRSFYKNDLVDELVREAAASSDIAERTRLYHQAQDLIMEDAPYIFLYQVQTIVPLRKNLRGYVYNPMLESMYNFESIRKE